MNKTSLIIIIVIILVVALFFVWYSTTAKNPVEPVSIPEGIILFYGDGCPHCKIVDDFIAENKIEEKINFSRLEVWYNKENQVIIAEVAEICQIASDNIGVPLLYDGAGKCYVGDVDVINFLKAQANIQ